MQFINKVIIESENETIIAEKTGDKFLYAKMFRGCFGLYKPNDGDGSG